jgi:hypothetical protein
VLVLRNSASAQAPDFLLPPQKGAFQVKGLSYLEISGWPLHFTDTVTQVSVNGSNYPVPSTGQIAAELKAAGTNLVKLTLSCGSLRSYKDNAYSCGVPFPA